MPPAKPAGDHNRRPSKKELDGVVPPSNTLWVGNFPQDTSDPDLMAVFGVHGALDSVTLHGLRSYAFVHFHHVDEAKAAMSALRGARIHGSLIRIEFARPARPCNQLWIGGVSLSATMEQLEDEFLKFGKIEAYKFLRDRNSAFIDYYKTEHAIAAQKKMNGKRLAGEPIRVDFLRQPPRREWSDRYDLRDGHLRSVGPPEPWVSGPRRHLTQDTRRDGPPSNVLWIGYPPSVEIDEHMLHNAMILFGEIEKIRCFRSRNYAFVEFRSIDEARRAKEGLQGRLFNDPRIQIYFSSSEHKDDPQPFSGLRGPRPDIFFNDAPFRPDLFFNDAPFGPARPVVPNSFPALLRPPGPNMAMRPFAPQGIDSHHGGQEFYEFGGSMHRFPDGDNNPLPPNWRRQSPVGGVLPSASGMQPPSRPMHGEWDGFNTREQKRSRFDSYPRHDDAMFHSRRGDAESAGESFGFPHPDNGGISESQHNHGVRSHGPVHASSENDHSWRGVIAKGGSHVCHARCVPIGKGIGSPFPEIINCSARTGLDSLTNHYTEANGFEVVFFLPDSEEDFAAYTAFLRYLGQKDRAGVAKLEDGTTLFLVPPSDFLSNVLNVPGPERLYGVVLKLPQQSTNSANQQPLPAIPPQPSHYMDQQPVPDPQRGYNFVPQNEERTLNRDYGKRSRDEGSMPYGGVENPQSAPPIQSYAAQSSCHDYVSKPAVSSQLEVSLTPELLATLASLLPSNSQPGSIGAVQMPGSTSARLTSSSASVMHEGSLPNFQPSSSGTHQMPVSTSMRPSSSSPYVMHDGPMPVQGWRQEHQANVSGVSLEQPSYPPQQLGYQYSNQAPPISHFSAYPSMTGAPDHSAQSAGSAITQDPSLSMQQATAVPTNPMNSYVISSQGGEFSASQNNQQYQLDSSFASHNNFGMLQTSETAGGYNPSIHQLKPDNVSANVQAESLSQHQQTVLPLQTDQVNSGFPIQGQQLQTVLSTLGQGTSEGDADKNQRYQSTLQFAANLLLQLQQQQQLSGQAMQGSANQQ